MIRTCRICWNNYESFDALTYDYTCERCRESMKKTKCLYCGKPSEDGLCDKCWREHEKITTDTK